ncbi:hypothetical protein J1N35_001002 [Gossypium stocksii]|uniref:Uncharacterized protein n=1 Tax=Gossypium stocksii TaxID=47602 RepID=A0A9D3WI21_9ROSI|nr:hypothetical protein J1N35_001002 [Gossypium stocksii]
MHEMSVVGKGTRVIEFSKIKETLEKERELEETTEKDDSEQEQVRNVSTNQHISEDSINKFQLHYLPDESLTQFMIGKTNTTQNNNNRARIIWYQSLRNASIRIMNKRVCDLEKFFSSRWPNLTTNDLQEGGYDANPVASCYNILDIIESSLRSRGLSEK